MNKERGNATGVDHMGTYEERRKKVQRFNLTSDLFFCKALEDKAACQEVVQILLGSRDFLVKEVKGQYSIRNIENRSVVLDILAVGRDGRMVNVEMQMADEGDHQKRVRYYLASLDMSFLEKGESYERLPDTYMIYITNKDFLNCRMGIYYIDRVIRYRGTVIDNGVCEVYVNLTCPCESEKVNELLTYIKRSESDYQTNTFPNLVKRVKSLKENREGVEMMCRILEEEREEGKAEGRAEGKAEGRAEAIGVLIESFKELGISQSKTESKIIEKFGMDPGEAVEYMRKYWNE